MGLSKICGDGGTERPFFLCPVIAVLCSLFLMTLSGLSRAAEAGPHLVLSVSAIDYGTVLPGEAPSRTLALRNGGPGNLKWLVTGVPTWITVTPMFGETGAEGQTLKLDFSESRLSPGSHSGDLVITSSGGTAVVSLSVFLKGPVEEAAVREEAVESWKISIEPENVQVEAGKSVTLRARVTYADGYREDITQSVDWTSTDPFVARFLGPGLLQGISRGTADVTAKMGDVYSPAVPVSVSAALEPVLLVNQETVDLGRVEQGETVPFILSVANTGKAPLFFEIVSEVPWVRSERDVSIWSYLRETRKAEAALSPGVYLGCPESSLEMEDFDPYFRWREARRQVEESVDPGETVTMSLSGETTHLEEGDYAGALVVRSNAGEKRVDLKIRVVRLQSIAISPVDVRMSVGQQRTFRVTGTWSDGRKTDLSGREEGSWVVSDREAGVFPVNRPVFVARGEGTVTVWKKRGNVESNTARVEIRDSHFEPVLVVSPRELDLGAIGPGETAKGAFLLENGGSGRVEWSTSGPHGWEVLDGETLAAAIAKEQGTLAVTVFSAGPRDPSLPGPAGEFLIELTVESKGQKVTVRKYLPAGPQRVVLPLLSSGGSRHVYGRFNVAEEASRPRMAIDPPVIDFGTVGEGKRAVRRIQVLNQGMGVLNWRAALDEGRSQGGDGWARRGRYLSFQNRELSKEAAYETPDRLRDVMALDGTWENVDGYPAARGTRERLTFSFEGTGLVLLTDNGGGRGRVRVSVDGGPAVDFDLNGTTGDSGVFPIAPSLKEGSHTVDLLFYGGQAVVEGVRILGEDPRRGQKGWVRIYPDNGTTAKEKDFVNVAVNTTGLSPGLYGSTVVFTSESGTLAADIALEVPHGDTSPFIDILGYRKGFNCLFTSRPAEEAVLPGGYEFRGVAFRLYREGTPGTTEFYRWYHRGENRHAYGYDKKGEGLRLDGYVLEGSIGNIATSRLAGSRELYRWFHPGTGAYFYSTDLKEERVIDRGFRYDGIAGYVR